MEPARDSKPIRAAGILFAGLGSARAQQLQGPTCRQPRSSVPSPVSEVDETRSDTPRMPFTPANS